MAQVKKAKEHVVVIPNKIGSLAALLRTLAAARVNIIALSGEGAGRTGRIRFVASDPVKTGRALAKAGIKAEKSDVLLVPLPDRPGKGAALMEQLAEAGVNIEAGYASAAGGKALLVLKVNKLPAAARVIRNQ